MDLVVIYLSFGILLQCPWCLSQVLIMWCFSEEVRNHETPLRAKCIMEIVENDDQEKVSNQQGVVSRCSCSCRRTEQTQEPATTRVPGGSGILTRRLRSNSNFSTS